MIRVGGDLEGRHVLIGKRGACELENERKEGQGRRSRAEPHIFGETRTSEYDLGITPAKERKEDAEDDEEGD